MSNEFNLGNRLPKIPMPFFGMGGRIVLSIYYIFWRLFHLGPMDFERTIRTINTPYAAQSWLFWNIKYRSDKEPQDHWQSARRTFDRKKGDCEDWAIITNKFLKGKGNILCMYTKSSGHATFIYRKGNNKWVSIGTFGLMWHKGTVEEIILDWLGYENYTSYRVYDKDLNLLLGG